jgi:DNA-binding NarL/FixJ family response regulator
MKTKVIIGDDHEVVREGLVSLLNGTDVEIIGVAQNGTDVLKLSTTKQPDVVLLDVRLNDEDGLDVLATLRKKKPELPVVMISTFDNPTYVARSIALGAVDYLLKGSTRDEMVDTLKRAARKEPPPDTSVMKQVQTTMERRKDKSDNPDNPLTNRERQVLRHIALGLSNKEIGNSLNISVETVKEHVQNILRKLHSPDRTAAAVWAVKTGLLD